MGFLDSVTDREAKALKKAQKLMEAEGGAVPSAESLKRAKEALDETSKEPSLVRKDEFSGSFARLSDLFLQAGVPDEALACADAALRPMPDNPYAVTCKARSLAAKGSMQEAVAALDTFLARTPTDKSLLVEKGWILDRSGKPAEAIECWKKALEVDPTDLFLYDVLASKTRDKSTWLMKKAAMLTQGNGQGGDHGARRRCLRRTR